MSRPLELLWAAIFAVLAVFATAEQMNWPILFGISLLTTAVLAAVEMRRPSYHGFAWKTINPGLREWWQARTSAE